MSGQLTKESVAEVEKHIKHIPVAKVKKHLRRIINLEELEDGMYQILSGMSTSFASSFIVRNKEDIQKRWKRMESNFYSPSAKLPEGYDLIELPDSRCIAAKRL